MGKFDEMCQAYRKARTEFAQYRKASHDFAAELWQKMIRYYEVPPAQAILYRINPKGGFDVANPPVGEFLGLRDDGYWEFGLGITVYDDPATFPRDTILLYLMVRRDLQGNYQARVNGTPEVFNIDRSDEASFAAFFDYVFKTIIESYETGLERLVKEQTTNRIGFDLNELTTAARTSAKP